MSMDANETLVNGKSYTFHFVALSSFPYASLSKSLEQQIATVEGVSGPSVTNHFTDFGFDVSFVYSSNGDDSNSLGAFIAAAASNGLTGTFGFKSSEGGSVSASCSLSTPQGCILYAGLVLAVVLIAVSFAKGFGVGLGQGVAQ